MKQVILLRHANYIPPDDITEAAKVSCQELSKTIGKFGAVYSSPANRCQQTAELVSGRPPGVDARAGTPLIPAERREPIRQLQQTNPLGIVGVLWSEPELTSLAHDAGGRLISLIKQVLSNLPDGGRALIITHDGTMVAAEQILRRNPFERVDHTYRELQGYVVEDSLTVKKFDPGR